MEVDKNKGIKIPHGDTFYLPVSFKIKETNTKYFLAEGESAVLTIKKQLNKTVVKTLTVQGDGSSLVEFKATDEEMKLLDVGSYTYDIFINKANGDTETLINPPANFTIKEVSHDV